MRLTVPASANSRVHFTERRVRSSSPRNPAAEVLPCDTGVLLAAGNVKDHARQACLRLLRHAEGPLLVALAGPGRDRVPPPVAGGTAG